MRILITAPSLEASQNVSGVAAVVKIIMAHRRHEYVHYILGRRDGQKSGVAWFVDLIRQLTGLPGALIRHDIELVHQNFPFDPKGILRESLVTLLCRAWRKPVVLHVHGGKLLMEKPANAILHCLATFMLRSCQSVIVLSEVEKASLESLYGFRDSTILSNAVDLPERSPGTIRPRPKGTPPARRTVLFLGRLHESKGLEDLVQAFRLVYPEHPFRFVACGAGPLEDFLRSTCSAILGDDFSFRGIVAGEDKQNAIDEADIFVLPSRYGEGLPIALLETMACGVVPVVTGDASMKVVVRTSFNGLIVAKRDPADLAARLRELLQDDELLCRLSLAAEQTIRDHYGIESYLAALESIYQRSVVPPRAQSSHLTDETTNG